MLHNNNDSVVKTVIITQTVLLLHKCLLLQPHKDKNKPTIQQEKYIGRI